MSIGQGVSRGQQPQSVISYTYSNDPYNSSALPCRLWSAGACAEQIERSVALAQPTVYARLHQWPPVRLSLEIVGEHVADAFGMSVYFCG